jgi:hypothetical protein
VVDALKKTGRWKEGEMNADAHVVNKDAVGKTPEGKPQ